MGKACLVCSGCKDCVAACSGFCIGCSGCCSSCSACCTDCPDAAACFPGCKLLYRLFGSNDGHCVSALSEFLRQLRSADMLPKTCTQARNATICGRPSAGSHSVAVSVFGLLHWLFGNASRVCVHVFASCSGCKDCATACSGFCIGCSGCCSSCPAYCTDCSDTAAAAGHLREAIPWQRFVRAAALDVRTASRTRAEHVLLCPCRKCSPVCGRAMP